MTELNGKTAFVTGASRGIGAAIAVGLAEHGADIFICDLARESDALAKVKAEVEATGRKCWSYDLDVTDKAAIEQVVADATEKSGGIDVLVNNIGPFVLGERVSEPKLCPIGPVILRIGVA